MNPNKYNTVKSPQLTQQDQIYIYLHQLLIIPSRELSAEPVSDYASSSRCQRGKVQGRI